MNCQRCKSERIMSVSGKCSDMCNIVFMHTRAEHDGYVPKGLNIGNGDYFDFDLCMDCGQLEGTWPLPPHLAESKGLKCQACGGVNLEEMPQKWRKPKYSCLDCGAIQDE